MGALRRATAERHAILDSSLALGGAAPTLHDYAAHLRMLQAWLLPLEAWLAAVPDGAQHAGALRERLALIEADLADPLTPGGPVPEDCARWSTHASAAYCWGVCYVIEGSQLGGAVLYQRLAVRLAPHPLRYLRPGADGPGPRWRQFMLALKANVTSEDEVLEACRGACDAFDRVLGLRG